MFKINELFHKFAIKKTFNFIFTPSLIKIFNVSYLFIITAYYFDSENISQYFIKNLYYFHKYLFVCG